MAAAAIGLRITTPSTTTDPIPAMLRQSVVKEDDMKKIMSGNFFVAETQQQPPQPRRGISFATTIQVIPARSPLDQLSDHEAWHGIWYDARELNHFRNDARHICKELSSTKEAASNLQNKVCSMAFDDRTRGLEQKACFERQRRKYVTIKHIVDSQKRLAALQLAKMSRQCSKWAVKLALDEAARDVVRAQQQQQSPEEESEMAAAVPRNHSNSDKPHSNLKRPCAEEGGDSVDLERRPPAKRARSPSC